MNKSKYNCTDFLFPNIGFWGGMGSVLNVRGNYFTFNYSKENEADGNAIRCDWEVTKRDLQIAVELSEDSESNKVEEKESAYLKSNG